MAVDCLGPQLVGDRREVEVAAVGVLHAHHAHRAFGEPAAVDGRGQLALALRVAVLRADGDRSRGRSLAGSVSLLCGFYAMTHYDVSVVLTLTNMYPLWVAVLSWPLMGELPSTDTWIAAVVGVLLAAGAISLFLYLVVYRRLRVDSNLVAWVDWGDGLWAMTAITVVGLALTLIPTLLLTRKYLKV